MDARRVALDIAAGRVENDITPWIETARALEILGEIKKEGGAIFPQDREP
ncbi:hypothetical protein F4776DRAFT_666446 [Hypoxylon sp. NC0597]|nr:hypothetical protein F4776DRAFT_666446 [Hypoxylon sp. NC0597]